MSEEGSTDRYFHAEVTRRVEAGGEEAIFFVRKILKPTRYRILTERDLRTTLILAADFVVASLAPCSAWAAYCRALAQVRMPRHFRKEFASFSRSLAAVLGEVGSRGADAIFRASQHGRHRRMFIAAAEWAARRWRPAIDVQGIDGLKRALERGRGAIVWCNQFTAQNLIGKRALWQAGLRVHQVSVAEHGFSHTRFARRVLNPLLVKRENRYLASRLVFERGDNIQVTRRIATLLKRNEIILMTNNVYSGSSFLEVPLGVSGYLQLATTPLNFAARTGAALFSMSTFETRPFEAYEAIISSEIPLGAAGINQDVHAAMAGAALGVRDHLLVQVGRYPEQYMGWPGRYSSVVHEQDRSGLEARSPPDPAR